MVRACLEPDEAQDPGRLLGKLPFLARDRGEAEQNGERPLLRLPW